MNYFQVAVASAQYHGNSYLTYHYSHKLATGTVVAVPLRQQTAPGVVISTLDQRPNYQTKAIKGVLKDKPLPPEVLKLMEWFSDYYPAPLGVIAKQFMPSFLLGSSKDNKIIQSLRSPTNLPALTSEQALAIKTIKNSPDPTYLIHGETGSGKTRLYIELAKDMLAAQRSLLILTPEIALTPQLVNNFEAVFPTQVLVTHSNLTTKARRQIWLEVLNSRRPIILIGPRSALFAPLANIGLIVVDEFHEPAYKQQQLPYYLANRVASSLARLHKAKLVMGSATPPISDYYIAQQKGLPILRLVKQARAKTLRPNRQVKVLDLKDRDLFTAHPFIAQPLIDKVQKALKKKQQALIFLNRRGSATLVVCSNCGWQATCPRCGLPLVYHADKHLFRCHTCGFSQAALSNCPVCGSTDIIFKGIGTKALETELIKLFPSARIKRFDTDNPKAERFEAHFLDVKKGQVDILVGTQLLSKGLDLPRLSVVGVIMADSSLSFPDYTAEERTYQLISQIIGRVGRGYLKGEIVIQSFNPQNPTIMAASQGDWPKFYARQLAQRQNFGFPPFRYLLKLQTSKSSRSKAETAATKLATALETTESGIEVWGPAPAFKERVKNKFIWQIVVKSKDRQRLVAIVKSLPSGWTYDLDPIDLL